MVCGALLLQRALYTVHCTNVMHSRKSSFVITPTVLVNTVNRYILYIRGNKIGHILLKQFPFITFDINAVKHLCFSPFTWRIDSCSSADQSIENMYIHTHMFVVNFDALALASDIRIERRLCWMQDSIPWSQCPLTNRLSYHAKNVNSTARPYDQQAFSPLYPTAGWLLQLALAICMFFVVNFDALAQASDFRIHIHIHNHIHIHIHLHIHIHMHIHIHILILMQFCHGFNVLWEAERTIWVLLHVVSFTHAETKHSHFA